MKADLFLCGLKGLCVGGTMLVPGVSGGSMAIILGVYDRLVTSVSSFMKHKRKSAIFLGIFALGALIGMFLFAKPLLSIIEKFTLPAMYFFIAVSYTHLSRMLLEKGKRHLFHYKTSFAEFMLGIFANKISNSVNDDGGKLNFSYTLDINSGLISENEIEINIKEANICRQ